MPAVAVATAPRPPANQAASPAPRFQIIDSRFTMSKDGTVNLIGEVKNTGTVAAGVQIEAIARDTNGKVVGSAKFWPASTRNIPPGETTAIDYFIKNGQGTTAVDFKVIDGRVWTP